MGVRNVSGMMEKSLNFPSNLVNLIDTYVLPSEKNFSQKIELSTPQYSMNQHAK